MNKLLIPTVFLVTLSSTLISCTALDTVFSDQNRENMRKIRQSLENGIERQRASDEEIKGQFDIHDEESCTYKTNRGDTITISPASGRRCQRTIEYEGLPAKLQ